MNDHLRRLQNLMIFFQHQSDHPLHDRTTGHTIPIKSSAKDIYTQVGGYRPADSPWFNHKKESSSGQQYPCWNAETVTRLIKNDVELLNGSAFPIRSEVSQGKEALYWMDPDTTFPSITFTPEEATLLAMLGQHRTTHDISLFTRIVWSKLGGDLIPEEYKEAFEYVPPEDVDSSKIMKLVDQAITNNKRISLTYLKQPNAPKQQRILDPWGIIIYEDRVFLVGYDLEKEDHRFFRFNHIKSLKILKHNRTHTATEGDIKRAFDDFLSRGRLISVIYRSELPLDTESKALDGHENTWKTRLLSRDRVLRLFAAQAPEVEVLEPEDFRQDVIDFLRGSPCL